MPLVIVDKLPKSVVPIFLASSRNVFEPLGSAVLCYYEEAFFMVTAGHVIARNSNNNNLIMQGWNGRMIETPENWLRTPVPEGGSPDDDRVDLAVAILTEEMAAGFFQCDYGFIDHRMIDPLPLNEYDHLVFVGFPGRSQTCVHTEQASLVHLRPAAFHTKLARRSEAIGCGFGADHYIVAEYRFSEKHPFPEQPKDVPLPPGMSGGAVYRFEDGRPNGLVGITHRWFDPGLLVATRAHEIWPMFDKELKNNPGGFRFRYPDLNA